ncbi:MAG: aminodeoxychorismate lyase, partial [Bacteroidota bacterium]
MYIRKILVGILIIGVIVGCFLMYSISQTIFKPITAFNNDEAYLYIPSNSDFEFVKKEIAPLLNDMQAFETLAKKLGYTKRVKGGKYIIRKGMNSN